MTVIEREVAVVLDGEILALCERVEALGIVLDRGLTFLDNIFHVTQRSIGRLNGSCRFRTLLLETANWAYADVTPVSLMTTVYLLLITEFRERTLADS
ncbi:hypothetical protein J6590_072463 [Homalodisca vitripennis]|nr:hypothetical protein J6590_072463 [Homalodisca vitripennis]